MRSIFKAVCVLLAAGSLWGQLQPVNLTGTGTVDAIAIVITRFGPYPAAVTHPAAPFLLFVVNRSGLLEDTFSLIPKAAAGSAAGATAAASTSLLDLHATASRQRDHQLISPLPGSYQLIFKSHPAWTVDITITAN
jgi:hypothetical protein